MVPALRFYWRDNNNKRGQQTFWLPAGLTIAAYVARANTLRDAAKALSNAQLESAELTFEDAIPGLEAPAAPEADVRVNLLLFFKDDQGFGSWRLPSPRQLLPYDNTGVWRGIRITPAGLDSIGLLHQVEAAAALTVFPWQTPFPATFVAAGIDTVVP